MARSAFTPMRDETEVRTFTDLLKVMENELGWCPAWDDPRPPWKVRTTEVSKLKRVIKKLEREQPRLKGEFTVNNLLHAIEYLKREKQHIKSPVYVAYALERALEWRHEQRSSGLADRAEDAKRLARERLSGEEQQRWVRQLTRARGDALADLLDEFETRIA